MVVTPAKCPGPADLSDLGPKWSPAQPAQNCAGAILALLLADRLTGENSLSESSVSGQQAPWSAPQASDQIWQFNFECSDRDGNSRSAPDQRRLLPVLHSDNIIDLPGQPGDVLSPDPSLAERGWLLWVPMRNSWLYWPLVFWSLRFWTWKIRNSRPALVKV